MSKVNVKIAGASYSDVPAITVPRTDGGTASFHEISDTTATASDVLVGKKFYTADGTLVTGTGDLVTIESADAWGIEVTQNGNQIITATPKVGYKTTSDGKYQTTLNADVSIEPYTGYVPGTIKKTADETNHLIKVTAGDAAEIEGVVENGYAKVYRNNNSFYSDAEYKTSLSSLSGKILIAGGSETRTSFSYSDNNIERGNKNITAYTDRFIKSAGDELFRDCTGLTSVDLSNLTTAGHDLLRDCTGITSVDLSNLTSALNYLLSGCTSLTSVDLSNLTTAGDDLLSSCASLTSVDLSNLTTAGNELLYNCKKLEKIIRNNAEIPAVGSSGWYTLYYIPSTCKLYVPASAVDAYKADSNFGTKFGDNILPITDDVTL